MTSIRTVEVGRVEAQTRSRRADDVVVEEPLEIRIAGDPIATTMRTPGDDRELVLGFLWAEGIIRSPDDVTKLAHCGRPGEPGTENTIDVVLVSGITLPEHLEAGGLARRGTIITSACGVCGRRSIDDLLERFVPLPAPTIAAVSARVIAEAMAGLRGRQPIFDRTGGCHAASLVSFDGAPIATFEDVGRHNAVDKVIGSRVRANALPISDAMLLVSGRASFEIVQKAIAARIAVIASVSAPSSLAVELAQRGNATLVGFVRGEKMTLYSGAERIA